MRWPLYAAIVLLFIAAGLTDLIQGETKLGVTAILFGIANAVIFFWR
ncbi:MAG TPA: hypothetical protein VMY35_11250 [Phycisphaerae bacterium]|nr:hypothetical protein [Phycisphaerae bacterium]